LTSLGLIPEGFFGHSSGEVLCGYADGTFTLEEALLFQHFRGVSFLEAVAELNIPGAMAAVGLSREQVTPKLPKNVYVACKECFGFYY
jgi:fatty acid synthase